MKYQDLKKQCDDFLESAERLNVPVDALAIERDKIMREALKCMQNGSVFGPQWARQLLRLYNGV